MATKDSELVTTSLLKKNFPKSILETHCHRGDETAVSYTHLTLPTTPYV